jgi:uridine kinase
MRQQFLATLADRISRQTNSGILRVAIDGVDGAGKTMLADELATSLRKEGAAVIRAGIDGFHHPRAVRYRLGRTSPEGFFRDSYNIDMLRAVLLDPLGPGGSLNYRTKVFDHRTDSFIDSPIETAVPPAVLLFDGLFLHRPELRNNWDLSVFLDVPFTQSYARMAHRDGSDADPMAAANNRYREGQKLYFAECRPHEAADILVDYADLAAPQIVRA